MYIQNKTDCFVFWKIWHVRALELYSLYIFIGVIYTACGSRVSTVFSEYLDNCIPCTHI